MWQYYGEMKALKAGLNTSKPLRASAHRMACFFHLPNGLSFLDLFCIACCNAGFLSCQPNPHLACKKPPSGDKFHFPELSASTRRCKLLSNLMPFLTKMSMHRFARLNLVSPGARSRVRHCPRVEVP